jgi:septum formation protein
VPDLILASTSPIRKSILQNAGLAFTCQKPSTDEAAQKRSDTTLSPQQLAISLAKAKARSLKQPNALVLGADQTLSHNNLLYDKPENKTQLLNQLKIFRATQHQLHSALAICLNGEIIWTICEDATLTMREFSDAFLAEYVENSNLDILNCVGGYKLEDRGIQLFEKIAGDYFTILGLPLLPLLAFLREQNYLKT